MVSKTPTDGRCNADAGPDKEGYCESYPVRGADRCRMHGGSTPTADENPNVGRGDQEGNGNAITHGVTASPWNLYTHLGDDAKEWVDALADAYCEILEFDDDDPRRERVTRACIHIYQSNSGENQILEDGLSEEQTVGVNDRGEPVVRDDGHHLHGVTLKRDKEARQILKTLGAFDDPESKKAEALEDSAAAWRSFVESQT